MDLMRDMSDVDSMAGTGDGWRGGMAAQAVWLTQAV